MRSSHIIIFKLSNQNISLNSYCHCYGHCDTYLDKVTISMSTPGTIYISHVLYNCWTRIKSQAREQLISVCELRLPFLSSSIQQYSCNILWKVHHWKIDAIKFETLLQLAALNSLLLGRRPPETYDQGTWAPGWRCHVFSRSRMLLSIQSHPGISISPSHHSPVSITLSACVSDSRCRWFGVIAGWRVLI